MVVRKSDSSDVGIVSWYTQERLQTGDSRTIYVRAEALNRPGMLIVERLPRGRPGNQALLQLRLGHWRYGPPGRLVALEPVDRSGWQFERTVFEVEYPRRSTVLAAAAGSHGGQGLILQFVISGIGRVNESLDQLFRECVEKALDTIADAS